MKCVKRVYTPGSEWIYFKIYAGYKTLDNILSQDISFVVNKLNKKCVIKKWFFIRYAEPDSHIRIRFLVCDVKYIGDVILLLHNRISNLVLSGFVWKIQLDTYNRELERYGYSLIEETESIFCFDSECILGILNQIMISQNENYRWMIALKMIDSLLSDFSFCLEDKLEMMKTVSDSFMTEFGFNKFNSKQFNSKFRNNKNVVEAVLSGTIKDDNFEIMSNLLDNKSIKLSPIIKQLQTKLCKRNDFTLNGLLISYIHMTLNRLFISKNRLHELVLYDFLKRYYTSEIAKEKYIK